MGNFIILGMAGYFSAIVRAPITGIILISEMTGSFSHLLTLSMVSLAAYLVPDMVHCAPVYDQLLHRLLAKQNPDKKVTLTGEKVLVEGMIYHGSAEHREIQKALRKLMPYEVLELTFLIQEIRYRQVLKRKTLT